MTASFPISEPHHGSSRKGPFLVENAEPATSIPEVEQLSCTSRLASRRQPISNLTALECRFAANLAITRDLDKTADQLGIANEKAKRMYSQRHIRALCDYEAEIVECRRAELAWQASQLTVEFLDATLVRDLKNTKLSLAKIELIQLGYMVLAGRGQIASRDH